MYRETKDSPHCFVAADVASGLVLSDLISVCFLKVEDCHVRPLVDIFANIFDGLDRVAEFDVDVGVKGAREQRTVRNDPPVVNLDFLILATESDIDLGCRPSILWFAAFVEWIAIMAGLSLLQGLLRVLLHAFAILMHGELGLKRPQGPWTIWLLMISCSSGSSCGLGSSA